jgi:hypothetical protein
VLRFVIEDGGYASRVMSGIETKVAEFLTAKFYKNRFAYSALDLLNFLEASPNALWIIVEEMPHSELRDLGEQMLEMYVRRLLKEEINDDIMDLLSEMHRHCISDDLREECRKKLRYGIHSIGNIF